MMKKIGLEALATPKTGEQRLSLGIVGCGAITEISHLPAALGSPAVEVVALVDSDPKRLSYLESEFGLPRIGTTHYEECFGRVDAVILALPNYLHASTGVEFLRRGIHLLCEKPLACTSEECTLLCEAARAGSVVMAVGYVTRFFPSTELTKELLERNFLGPLESFDYEFGTEGGWSPLSGYNLSRSMSGGGVLVVSGSHFLDRMLFLFGPPKLVNYADDGRGGVEANAEAVFEFAVGGAPLRGKVTVSKTRKLANRLRIIGRKGILEVAEGQSRSVSFFPTDSATRHEISYAAEPVVTDYFKVQLEDFVAAIRSHGKPKITGDEASRSIALIEECYHRVVPLREPWGDSTLNRLRAALPLSHSAGDPTDEYNGDSAPGVVHAD